MHGTVKIKDLLYVFLRYPVQILNNADSVEGLHDSSMVMGRDSPVGIATRYGLDGPRIESW